MKKLIILIVILFIVQFILITNNIFYSETLYGLDENSNKIRLENKKIEIEISSLSSISRLSLIKDSTLSSDTLNNADSFISLNR